jgi:hypothetical protein
MILHTERRGTNLVGMFVIREHLDGKQSTKLLDRVLYVDLVSDGNTLCVNFKGLGERWTEEKGDALRISGQHLLIHLEKSVRDVNGHCRSGHRGSSL